MARRLLVAVMMVAGLSGYARAVDGAKISEDELVRRTQALNDAVSVGDKTPWTLYYADDAFFFDEKGRRMDKSALVGDVNPLPKGYSGTIRVVNAQSLLLGTTAILTYDLDETETIFGQELKARYHGTDTWMFRGKRWQIVATQLLRYYEDPARGKVDSKRLDEYVGTYEVSDGVTEVEPRGADSGGA
jgi:hypothetical protein